MIKKITKISVTAITPAEQQEKGDTEAALIKNIVIEHTSIETTIIEATPQNVLKTRHKTGNQK